MRFATLILILFGCLLYAQENLDTLLSLYKSESDLSNITKEESAGFLDLYTRDDLEKMQAHNLLDILKSISNVYLTKGSNNIPLFAPATLASLPLTAARLYINDHDMTSSSFGSAFLMWGEMPVEYIDHIEVYKGSSSIEFGNEPGLLVIRVYTKNALRDSGSKVRIAADQKASYDLNLYTAQTLQNDLSYFVYANINNYNNNDYHHLYQNKNYTIKNDREGYNFYGVLSYIDTQIEIGNYHKRNDSFLGAGSKRTPEGGELDGNHFYIHFTQKLPFETSLQVAYDQFDYKRTYIDPNGVRIFNDSNYTYVKNYLIEFEDKIYSLILEKRLTKGNNSLLLGAFYKRKEMEKRGQYDTFDDPHIANALDLYSLYADEQYDFDKDTRFIAMLKGDFYRYKKAVKKQNELIARAGLIKNINSLQLKLFYTYTYIPNGFYQLYNPKNTPFIATPTLNNAKADVYTGSIRYMTDRWNIEFRYAYNQLRNSIGYTPYKGYYNSDTMKSVQDYEVRGEYYIHHNSKVLASVFSAHNSDGEIKSPKYGVNVRWFYNNKKLNIYNELLYRSSFSAQYTSSDIFVPYSLDWTLSVKYIYTKDFHIGLRGENLLDRSQYMTYRGYDQSVQMFDRKVWIDMEWTF